MSYSYTGPLSEEVSQKYYKIEGSLRILHNGTRTTIDNTFHLTDQSSRKEVPFFVRGLHQYCRWCLCIGVARGIATNREHVSCHAAIPGRSKCWHMRELHVGRVGRVVLDRAHLLANKNYYERRI